MKSTEPNFVEKLAFMIFSEKNLNQVLKYAVALAIFAAFLVKEILGYSSLQSAFIVGGITSGIFLLLTSHRPKNWLHFRTITGYWMYSIFPEAGTSSLARSPEVPRVVLIEDDEGTLRLRGWLADGSGQMRFHSTQVYFSNFGKRAGNLVYWYTTPDDAPSGSLLKGLVSLEWSKAQPAQRISRMAGFYVGRATNHIGTLEFVRISEAEFRSRNITLD